MVTVPDQEIGRPPSACSAKRLLLSVLIRSIASKPIDCLEAMYDIDDIYAMMLLYDVNDNYDDIYNAVILSCMIPNLLIIESR